MSTLRRSTSVRRPYESHRGSYWAASQRPLHILVFLLPLIIVYELGLALLLRSEDGDIITNVAHVKLLEFFETFGIAQTSGLFLGGIVIIVVLVIWHLLLRDRWRVDLKTIGGMAVESAALVIPLILVGQLIVRSAISVTAISGGADYSAAELQLAELDLWSRLAISIGAGLYEELVFRMLLIFIIHTLLVDVCNASSRLGSVVAVAVSAAAFTWYHPLAGPDGALSPQRLIFFFVAGLYFGAIFVMRGFGIVVGVHALYDIVMVTTLDAPAAE